MSNKIYINQDIGKITGYFSSNLAQGFYDYSNQSNTYLEEMSGFTYDSSYLNRCLITKATEESNINVDSIDYTTTSKVVTSIHVTIQNLDFVAFKKTKTYLQLLNYASIGITLIATYTDAHYTKTMDVFIPLKLLANQAITTVEIELPLFDSYYNTGSNKYYSISTITLDSYTLSQYQATDSSMITQITSDCNGKFKAVKISYTAYTPSTDNILATLRVPTLTSDGKVFLKKAEFTYPRQLCIKKNHGNLTSYPYHSGSSPYNKSWDSKRVISIYESTEDSFRGSYPDSMFSISDSIASNSFDSSQIYFTHYQDVNDTGSWSSSALGTIDYAQLEKIAFGDECFCKLSLRNSSGAVTKTIIKNINGLIKDGIDCPSGTDSIYVQLSMLNLVNLVGSSFVDNINGASSEQDYVKSFPADALIGIEMTFGYQSTDTSAAISSVKKGIYIGVSKTRRLFIDNKEIQGFVVGPLSDKTNTLTATCTTGTTVVGYNVEGKPVYSGTNTQLVSGDVASASITDTDGFVNSVVIEGRYLHCTIHSTSPSKTVSATVTYNMY